MAINGSSSNEGLSKLLLLVIEGLLITKRPCNHFQEGFLLRLTNINKSVIFKKKIAE